MCDAERDLRNAERDIEHLTAKLEKVVLLIDDVVRGIVTPDEAQREAHRIDGSVYAR